MAWVDAVDGAASWLAARATNGTVTSQAVIFEGLNPSKWNSADPIILLIIQVTIVVSLTRALYWPLSEIREPKVIAEVITGVILGLSIMGRIPGFTYAIFPKESMPSFKLAANLGLVLFLFLVGLEINLNYLLSNWRISISVAALDMTIPFGLGVAVAWGLYNQFVSEPGIKEVSFGALFIGVAMAITAFPVLCRILTSLKLLNTNVGVITLSSGIANDVVGWVLLALCVTLVNSGAGVTSVYVLLTAIGWALFLAYAVRPAFIYVVAIIVVAFLSKIAGGTIGARMNRLVWRESFTIGTLMSCKGLVELIVLNIGLEAKILSTRTFTMFVVMALVTTFATAPAVSFLYPPAYQRKLQLLEQGRINWDGTPIHHDGDDSDSDQKEATQRMFVWLRMDGLSSLLSVLGLFTNVQRDGQSPQLFSNEEHPEKEPATGSRSPQNLLCIHGHRLVELSHRDWGICQQRPHHRAFGTCANSTTPDVVVSGQLAVVPQHSFAETLVSEASNNKSDLIVLPWSETGTASELQSFFSAAPRGDLLTNSEFSSLVGKILDDARPLSAVATFIDSHLLHQSEDAPAGLKRTSTGLSITAASEAEDSTAVKFYSADATAKKHIYVLYAGGLDDIYAVRLGIQLAQNDLVKVTIVDASSSDSSGYARDTMLILGRAEGAASEPVGAGSDDLHKLLGLIAAVVVTEMKETKAANTSLMVV
uniref:Cation/H+ exchanger transmembrane domain-containing protein n=1 Tax=Bionectria ochroleuca TaxID=29856 RepID=A0A0B7JU08_BIOOC